MENTPDNLCSLRSSRKYFEVTKKVAYGGRWRYDVMKKESRKALTKYRN